jgi:Domain of unknown function (DUF4129)
LTVSLLALLCVCAIGRSMAGEAPPITDAQVAQAVATIAADPNMGSEQTIHTLQMHSRKSAPPGATLRWLENLLNWLASSGRVLFWILVATLAAFLLVLVLRALRAPRRRAAIVAEAAAATHVGTLDIRPESLPEDIGAAALALWESGQQRAALSLLYRGALSRLVHRHAVPIHDSNTEAECVALASARLSPERAQYVSQLVDCWIRAVYAERMPAGVAIRSLCGNFAALLDVAGPDWTVGAKA